MSNKIVPVAFQGHDISFNNDGWINATDAAKRFNKRPVDWLKLDSTKEYLNVFMRQVGISGKSSLIKTKKTQELGYTLN